MPASRYEQDLAASKGVRIVFNAMPVEILGNGAVTGVRAEYTKSDGHALTGTGETFDVPADQVLKAIGQTLEGAPDELELARGKIAVTGAGKTSVAGGLGRGRLRLGRRGPDRHRRGRGARRRRGHPPRPVRLMAAARRDPPPPPLSCSSPPRRSRRRRARPSSASGAGSRRGSGWGRAISASTSIPSAPPRRDPATGTAPTFATRVDCRNLYIQGEGEDVSLVEVPIDYMTSITFTLTDPDTLYIDLDDGTAPDLFRALPLRRPENRRPDPWLT